MMSTNLHPCLRKSPTAPFPHTTQAAIAHRSHNAEQPGNRERLLSQPTLSVSVAKATPSSQEMYAGCVWGSKCMEAP